MSGPPSQTRRAPRLGALRGAMRSRRRARGDAGGPRRAQEGERGSIVLTLLLIVVLSILAVTVTTGAIAQLELSSSTSSRNGALQGALAGVQAVVADIRGASTNGYVDTTSLPCSSLSGVTNVAGSASYRAAIQYYDESPQGTYSAVGCTEGQGPASPASGNFLARAVITSCSPSSACSTPNAAPAPGALWRRVVSTYDFNTSDANIPGGLVYSYDHKECLTAAYENGSSPSGGVTLEATMSCATGNPMEQFQYRPNWNLDILLGGVDYCVQDPLDSGSSGSPVPLSTNCSAQPSAQWGINDVGGIEGVATSGSPSGQPNGSCLRNPLSGDSGAAQDVTVGSCDGGFDNTTTWQMSSSVGAGGSQPPAGQVFGVTDQLVNLKEFGDCLDVTNASTSSPFLIDYMCKQFPDTAGYPIWNQRWCFHQVTTDSAGNPEGVLYTPYGQTGCTNPSSPYCLQAPAQLASQNSQSWVTVTSCNLSAGLSGTPSDLLWSQWGTSGGALHDYTWTDAAGACLEANTANPQKPSGNGDAFSPIQIDTCNGSFEQKWNAPPTFGVSQIANTHEGTGSGTYTGP